MFIFLLGLQAVNVHLKFAPLTFPLLGLHHRVLKVPPVAAVPTSESAIIDLNVLALPGTARRTLRSAARTPSSRTCVMACRRTTLVWMRSSASRVITTTT
jgi:hypothetical protein